MTHSGKTIVFLDANHCIVGQRPYQVRVGKDVDGNPEEVVSTHQFELLSGATSYEVLDDDVIVGDLLVCKLDTSGPEIVLEAMTEDELDVREYGSVDRARASILADVDNLAGSARKRIMTDIFGQPTIYRLKEAEARLYLIDPTDISISLPFLTAEADATGEDVATIANAIVQQADACMARSIEIEGIRHREKHKIRSYTTYAELRTALEAVNFYANQDDL